MAVSVIVLSVMSISLCVPVSGPANANLIKFCLFGQ